MRSRRDVGVVFDFSTPSRNFIEISNVKTRHTSTRAHHDVRHARETKIESYLNFFPPHRTKFKIVPGPKRKRAQKTAQKGNVVA